MNDVLKLLDLDDLPRLDSIAPDPVLLEAMTPVGGDIVQELRTAHHLLAKTLAQGTDPLAAAARCGMTMTRVKKLQNDPTFQELLEYYKGQQEEIFASVKDRLAALGMTFVDILQERALDAPEKFTNRELKDFAAEFLERTIAPAAPSRSGGSAVAPIQINVNFVEPPKNVTAELELKALPVDPLKDL